jgi:hypothetical protein
MFNARETIMFSRVTGVCVISMYFAIGGIARKFILSARLNPTNEH